jgi:hypothetical protein
VALRGACWFKVLTHSQVLDSICKFALPLIFAPNEATVVRHFFHYPRVACLSLHSRCLFCISEKSQVTAASAVLYNAALSLASSGRDNDDVLMEIGSAAAQSIANGTLVLLNYSRVKQLF